MPESPSELLTAAADRVRDLAAASQRGPWVFDESTDRVMVDDTQHSVTCYAGADYDDSQWIAALSPAVAGPIEALLRDLAPRMDSSWVQDGDNWSISPPPEYVRAALALARVLVPEMAGDPT